MKKRPAETELGVVAAKWLERQGFEVFQEVAFYGRVADLVGRAGRVLCVVELKVSMCLDLLAQGERWTDVAHYTWIAYQAPTRITSGMAIAQRFCRSVGVGMLELDLDGHGWRRDAPRERLRATFNRTGERTGEAERLRKSLHEAQKTIAPAGTNGGGHWTPFKATCAEVLRVVKEKPGIAMKDLIETIQHHYASPSSARATLASRIEAGIVPGVRIEREGRRLKVVLA